MTEWNQMVGRNTLGRQENKVTRHATRQLGQTMSQGAKTIKKTQTRLKTNFKLTVLNNTKLHHFWAQIVSWAPRHARKTFIVLAQGVIRWVQKQSGQVAPLGRTKCNVRYTSAGQISPEQTWWHWLHHFSAVTTAYCIIRLQSFFYKWLHIVDTLNNTYECATMLDNWPLSCIDVAVVRPQSHTSEMYCCDSGAPAVTYLWDVLLW